MHGVLSSPRRGFIYDQYARVVMLHWVNAVYKHPPYELVVDPGKAVGFQQQGCVCHRRTRVQRRSPGHHLGGDRAGQPQREQPRHLHAGDAE